MHQQNLSISGITITNFKSVCGEQRIDFRPITLLFGPNSAGKSTVLQALQFMRELLERGNVDPDRTIAGGDCISVRPEISYLKQAGGEIRRDSAEKQV